MATGVRAITRGRMKEWTSNLTQKHHTPILVIGLGHDQVAGQLSVISIESMTNRELALALERALDFIRARPQDDEEEASHDE